MDTTSHAQTTLQETPAWEGKGPVGSRAGPPITLVLGGQQPEAWGFRAAWRRAHSKEAETWGLRPATQKESRSSRHLIHTQGISHAEAVSGKNTEGTEATGPPLTPALALPPEQVPSPHIHPSSHFPLSPCCFYGNR